MKLPIVTEHLLINRLASDRADGLRITTTPAQLGSRAISHLIEGSKIEKTEGDDKQEYYFVGQRPGMPTSEVWVFTADGSPIEPYVADIIETAESTINSVRDLQ